jgi:hypothetical protein
LPRPASQIRTWAEQLFSIRAAGAALLGDQGKDADLRLLAQEGRRTGIAGETSKTEAEPACKIMRSLISQLGQHIARPEIFVTTGQ